MKKYFVILLSVLFCFTLIGCSNSNNSSTSSNETETSDNPNESTNTEGSDVLIAYFSQTGNTQVVAEYISADLNGNLFQIIPTQPYSEDDVDYNTENSRSMTESQDDSARPEIQDTVEDMSKFSYVFLGYPIWYGQAPKIISTFLESYDFSGKTIIPFCTSGSTGIEDSITKIQSLASNATWLPGMRFSSNVTKEEVTNWINTLNIKE